MTFGNNSLGLGPLATVANAIGNSCDCFTNTHEVIIFNMENVRNVYKKCL
jgi:hypothetical protein